MVQKTAQQGTDKIQNGEEQQTEEPQMIARLLMAGGLCLFWVLVGHAFDQDGLGIAAGCLGAAMIWVWTAPRPGR